MIAYVLRRLALAVSMVWAVSFGSFVAFGLSFDPTYGLLMCLKESCREQRRELIAQFHLHDPILERYWLWLSGLFSHGFGRVVMGGPPVFRMTQDIGPLVWRAAAVTGQLIAVSLVLVVVFSVVVGVVSARWQGTPADWLLRLLAYVAWSMPTFLVGVLLARWLLPTGWFFAGTPGGGVEHWLRTMALPAVTLSLGLIGLYSRYVRSSMLVELRQPYAVVARAKGLSERRVLVRHALRNSLVPFTSVVSLELASIVGASLATDYVFQMGGLAQLFLGSLGEADPFALTAILVVIGGIVATFVLLSDLVLGWLDPRARVGAHA